MPLSSVRDGGRVWVQSLPPQRVLRERLLAMGIRPGVELEVLRRGKPGGILHLACGVLEFMLRCDHAAQLQVSPHP